MEKSLLPPRPARCYLSHSFSSPHILVLPQRQEKPPSLPIKNHNFLRRGDGFHKGFIPFFFHGCLKLFTFFELYPLRSLPVTFHSWLTCPSAPAFHPGSNPVIWSSSSAVSPRFFLCCGFGQLQKSPLAKGPPALESCILYSIPAVAWLRSIPCKDAFAIFANPSSSICALRFPPWAAAGFFRCLLIINSCSSFVSLTSNPLSVISVLTVAASALYLIHQVWLPLLEFCSAEASWSELELLPSCPQKQHKFHLRCIGAF